MIVITTYLVIDKKETAVNIRQLMKVNNVTPKELQHYLDFSCIQSIYHWLDGSTLPSIDNLVLLSHLWDIPINDILRCRIVDYRSFPY